MDQEVAHFGEKVCDRTQKHRIEEYMDQYQAESEVVLDLSDTEYISRSIAKILVRCNLGMKISEPVKRMMEVVESNRR